MIILIIVIIVKVASVWNFPIQKNVRNIGRFKDMTGHLVGHSRYSSYMRYRKLWLKIHKPDTGL